MNKHHKTLTDLGFKLTNIVRENKPKFVYLHRKPVGGWVHVKGDRWKHWANNSMETAKKKHGEGHLSNDLDNHISKYMKSVGVGPAHESVNESGIASTVMYANQVWRDELVKATFEYLGIPPNEGAMSSIDETEHPHKFLTTRGWKHTAMDKTGAVYRHGKQKMHVMHIKPTGAWEHCDGKQSSQGPHIWGMRKYLFGRKLAEMTIEDLIDQMINEAIDNTRIS